MITTPQLARSRVVRGLAAWALPLALLLAGQSRVQAQPGHAPSATFIGTVYDARTDRPVPGAQVAISGASALTDARGAYTITVPAALRVYAQLSAPGYQTSGLLTIFSPDGNSLSGRLGFSFRGGSGLVSAFASGDGSVTLTPFAQIQAQGAAPTLAGSASAPLEADAALQFPSGRVSFVPIAQQGAQLSIALPPLQEAGRYVLEINAAAGFALIKAPLFVGRLSTPRPPPAFQPDPPGASVETLEAIMRGGVGQVRQRAGLPPLQDDRALAAVARTHSEDIVRGDYYRQHAHIGADGSTPATRVQGARIAFSTVAEDVAMGTSTQEALLDLLDSPGHRAAILGPFRAIGVGAARAKDAAVFTLDFVR